jgi:hypothetical protein
MFKNRKQLPQNHVLSFRDLTKDQNLFFVTDDDLLSSALVLAPSAKDRATLVVSPILDRLIAAGHSGLVIDTIEAYGSQSLGKHKPNALLVGASDNAYPINLLDMVSPDGFRSILMSLVAPDERGAGAVNDAMLTCLFLQETSVTPPTLSALYEALTDSCSTASAINEYLRKTARVISSAFAAELAVSLADPDGLIHAATSFFDDSPSHGSSGRLLPVLNALKPFWSNSLVRTKLCANSKVSFKRVVVERRKTVFFDMPLSLFGEASVFTARILMQGFRDMLGALTVDERPNANEGFSWNGFLIVDDCAEILKAQDTHWFSAGCGPSMITMFATSSQSALFRAFGVHNATALISGIRTKVLLPTDDDLSLGVVAKNGLDPQFLLDPQSPRTCFLHKGLFPVVRGEYVLEQAEPQISGPAITRTLISSEHVNQKFEAPLDHWYIVGPKNKVAINKLVAKIRGHLPPTIRNPEALMSNVTAIPLDSTPDLDGFRTALLKVFSRTGNRKHLVFAASAADQAFIQALNLPEVVKTVKSLVEAGHLERFDLSFESDRAKSVLRTSTPGLLPPEDVALTIAKAVQSGEVK